MHLTSHISPQTSFKCHSLPECCCWPCQILSDFSIPIFWWMLPAGQHTFPQSSNHLKLVLTQTVNSSLYSYEIPIFCRTPSGCGRMRNFDLQPTNEHTLFFLSHFSSQYSWQPVSSSSKGVLLLYIQSMSNLNQPSNSREEFSEYESLLSVHPLFHWHSSEHTDTLSFEHKLKSFAEQPRLPHWTKVGR